MSNPFSDYPLDDVNVDQRVNEVLGFLGVSSCQPDGKGPGIRYMKFIPLDKDNSRLLEFFVEAKIDKMPKSLIEGYKIDDVNMISGVMMRRCLGGVEGESRKKNSKVIAQYIPEDTFISEFLSDPVTRIRAARWFSEYRKRAAFDEDTIESVNQDFLPTLGSNDTLFEKVLH